MGVVMKAVDEFLDVFVNESVMSDPVLPILELGGRRQLSVEDQVGNFQVVAELSELLDWISSIAKNPLVAIDKCYPALAGGCVHECRIVSHQAKIVARDLDLSEVGRPDSAILYWHLILFPGAVVQNRKCALAHKFSLPAV